MNTGIYEIVNLLNGNSYIGSSCEIRQRWKMHRWHLNRGSHYNPHLQASWSKHGPENFAFRMILVCAREHLVLYEQAAFDKFHPVFNVAPRAYMPCVVMSPEARQRASDRMKGNTNTLGLKHSPESIELMRRAQLGNTYCRGRKLTPEHIAKVVAHHVGAKRSPETCARISAARAGKKAREPRSAEWCANLSAAMRGKPKSREHIEKMRATKKGQTLSPAHRAAIGAASRLAWAKRKSA